MFRIDSEHVVDATRTGGLARYSENILIHRNCCLFVFLYVIFNPFTTTAVSSDRIRHAV